jgi:integrase/recombinase XerD
LGQTPKQNILVTLEQAVAAYLDDKRSQQLEEATLKKLETIFRKQMLSWCHAAGLYLLAEFDLTYLRQWRSSWTDGAMAMKKKQERVCGFFYYCQWLDSRQPGKEIIADQGRAGAD